MGMIVVENDYKYVYVKNGLDDHARVVIKQDGFCEGALIVEFYLNSPHSIYYFRTPVINVEKTSDMEVIQMAFEEMIVDRNRWIDSPEVCQHFIEIFPHLIIESKTGKYRFVFPDVSVVFQLHVTEDATGHCMMRLFSDHTTDRIICDFDVSDGADIITRAKDYVKGLNMLIDVFERNSREFLKPTATQHISFNDEKGLPALIGRDGKH